jgi:zinc protease
MSKPFQQPSAWLSWRFGTRPARKCTVLLTLLLTLSKGAQTQPAPSDAAEVERATLSNGVNVVAQRAPGASAAALCLTYRVGSRDEGPGQRGLARLLESLMTQGSRNLGPGDAARLVSQRGGQMTSVTTSDLTQFCTELPQGALSVALWLEADRMRNLSATPSAFATQRDLLLLQQNARASSELHAGGLQRLRQLAYQDYRPYQAGELGDGNDLQTLSLRDAQDFHWRYYTPSNAVVSIVSDETPSQVIQLATRYFAAASNRAAAPSPVALLAPSRQSSERLSVLNDDNCVTPGVYYGYRIADASNDDHRIAQVIARLLGGSDAARMPQNMIIERGSALQAKAWLLDNDAGDLFAIYVQVAPLSSVDKVQEVVEAELKRLRFFGPGTNELEIAKTTLTAELRQASSSPLRLAQSLGQQLALGRTFDLDRELAALRAITPDQVRRVAQLYFPEHKRSVVEIYPPGWPQDEAPLVVVLKHTVKRGENLEGIARRYGSSVSEIVRVSAIDAKRTIQPGQVLKVPVVGGKAPTSSASTPAPMRSHKVRAGDSLSLIAKIYGTSVAEIVRLNALDRNKPIRVGQKLVIPPKRITRND